MAQVKKTIIGVLALFIPVIFMNGCCSSTLAPKVSESDKKRISQTYFDVSIGVKQTAHGSALFNKEVLKSTGLFRKVDQLTSDSDCSEYDLIMEFEDRGNYANPIPIFTGLTLGLFPTIADDQGGYTFNIYPCNKPQNRIKIDCRYEGKVVLGWYAIVDSTISANQYSCGESAATKRFYNYLSWKIVQKEDDIKHLLK